jgi:site-specific DNA-cytosine methylase
VYVIGHLRNGGSAGKIFPIGRKAAKCNQKSSGTSPRYTSVAPIKHLKRNARSYPIHYALTLDTCDTNGIIDNRRIRVYTQHERERLQGYPEGWTDAVSESARRKLLGNAVTVNVIEAIAERILTCGINNA